MGRAKIAVQASTIKNKFKELGPYETLKWPKSAIIASSFLRLT